MIMIQLDRPFSPVDYEILFRVMAAHESGHKVMYLRFGIQSEVALEFDAEKRLLGAVTSPQEGSLTRFERAAVGWAGIVAEYLLGLVLRARPEIPNLTAASLVEWRRAIRTDDLLFSKEDRALIAMSCDGIKPTQFAFNSLSSPVGSSLLYEHFERLVLSFRAQHYASGKRGSGQRSEVQTLARGLFDPYDVPVTSGL